MDPHEYTDDNIVALSLLEAMRSRVDMYFPPGETSRSNQMVMEALCESLHEIHCGHCDRVDVWLEGSRAIIEDNSRGFPTELDSEGIPRVQRHFTVLYTCRDAKLDDEVGEKLCIMGVIATNFMSRRLAVEMVRNGRLWTGEFKDGVISSPFEDLGPDERKFCRIEFDVETDLIPDPFDPVALRTWLDSLQPDIDTSVVTIRNGGGSTPVDGA